jgi:hypothetical protein
MSTMQSPTARFWRATRRGTGAFWRELRRNRAPTGPVRVRDARGREVCLVSLGPGAEGRGVEPSTLRAARRGAWAEIPWKDRARLGAQGAFLLIWAAAISRMLWVIWGTTFRPSTEMVLLLGVQIAFGFLGLFFTWREITRKHAAGLAQAMAKAGCCASCGYGLAGLTPQGDGCVVCPECEAAWRVV